MARPVDGKAGEGGAVGPNAQPERRQHGTMRRAKIRIKGLSFSLRMGPMAQRKLCGSITYWAKDKGLERKGREGIRGKFREEVLGLKSAGGSAASSYMAGPSTTRCALRSG